MPIRDASINLYLPLAFWEGVTPKIIVGRIAQEKIFKRPQEAN